MVDGKNIFDQPVKNNLRTCDSIRKIATSQARLSYNYFKDYYKMIAIDLSKQRTLDADPKSVHQINFTGNLENNASILLIIEEAKETILDFSQGTVKVLYFYFALM